MSYRRVSLPSELIEKIEDMVKSGKYGYKSIAEFVKEACRKRLEELQNGAEMKVLIPIGC